MNRIRWYGPTFVLVGAMLLVMIAGPRVAQRIAWAQANANITLARDSLTQNPSLAELSDAFRKVSEAVGPSVVHIQVSVKPRGQAHRRNPEEELLRRFFGPGRGDIRRFRWPDEDDSEHEDDPSDQESFEDYNVPRVIGSGSGWVYSGEGHIITNYHVVKDAHTVTVRFHDGTESKATIVGTDPKTDIAVLRVDHGRLHPATLADQPVEQGNIVFAFGSPFGFEFSMSQGIVSAKGRQLGILSHTAGYENFIQTDAAINKGNSGGPMTNIYGQVVGMNTAIATRSSGFQGLGFAIPVDMVQHVVDQLIDQGRVSRGYLGIYIGDLDPKLGKTFGYEGTGVLVQEPIEGGPAAEAGIQRGDIITKLDGKPVHSADELRHTVALHAPGTKLKLSIFRNGEASEAKITIGELPEEIASRSPTHDAQAQSDSPDKQGRQLLRKLGLNSVIDFTQQTAKQLNKKFTPGVYVRSVRLSSAAHAAGIQRGHLITAVMGVPVSTVEELVEQLQSHNLTQGIRISVRDGNLERFILLELPED